MRNLKESQEKIEVDGVITEALPATMFRVRLDNGHELLAYLSGKMRKNYIRVLLGDRVRARAVPLRPEPRAHRFPLQEPGASGSHVPVLTPVAEPDQAAAQVSLGGFLCFPRPLTP